MDIRKWITKGVSKDLLLKVRDIYFFTVVLARTAVTLNGLCLGLFQLYLYHCHSMFTLDFVALCCNYDKVIKEFHIALGCVGSCGIGTAHCVCVCVGYESTTSVILCQLFVAGFWERPLSKFPRKLASL